MFTTLQWFLFIPAAVVTFLCYESIPYNLEILRAQKKTITIGKIVTSHAFTYFVKVCGYDHVIMAFGMLAMGYMHTQHNHAAVEMIGWIVVASEIFVATVSLLSAYLIKEAAKHDAKATRTS